MEFRVDWMMPVATTEAAPFWDQSKKWSIPVRLPYSKKRGLNTLDYFNAKAYLFDTRALNIAA